MIRLIAAAALAAVVAACSSSATPAPGATSPPSWPTQRQVVTYRDDASHVTCWIAEGRDGVAMACLRDAP